MNPHHPGDDGDLGEYRDGRIEAGADHGGTAERCDQHADRDGAAGVAARGLARVLSGAAGHELVVGQGLEPT